MGEEASRGSRPLVPEDVSTRGQHVLTIMLRLGPEISLNPLSYTGCNGLTSIDYQGVIQEGPWQELVMLIRVWWPQSLKQSQHKTIETL